MLYLNPPDGGELTAGVEGILGLAAEETAEECASAELDGTASLEASGAVFSDETAGTKPSPADCAVLFALRGFAQAGAESAISVAVVTHRTVSRAVAAV